jgi:hypothetical protein
MSSTVQVGGLPVSWDTAAMESLRQHAMERFLAAEPVGEEIVGILYGRNDKGMHIAAWRVIERENSGSPAVPLPPADEESLRKLAGQTIGDEPAVGWFRSRTRGMAALSPEDLTACQRIFEARDCVALILRPSTQRPVAASFSIVSPGMEQESSRRGVRVSLNPRKSEMEAAPRPVTNETIRVAPPGFTQVAPPPSRRWLLKPFLAFAGGILASTLATYFLLDRPLRLQVRVNGPQLVVQWNRSAGFLTRAAGADLKIGARTVSLSQSQLRQGRWTTPAPSGDFAVSLHLKDGISGPLWAGTTVVRPVGER